MAAAKLIVVIRIVKRIKGKEMKKKDSREAVKAGRSGVRSRFVLRKWLRGR